MPGRVGGVPEGGSNKSERSLPDPGENGESRSMSIGDPEFNVLWDLKMLKQNNKMNKNYHAMCYGI